METDRLEDMRDSPRRKRAASPDSASKRRTQTPSSSSRDVSPPSPSPAQDAYDASPSSSRSTETMEYELPARSYVPYAQGRNPYSVNGGRYESNSEVHERLAGWSMNELGSMDRPPPNWAPNNALRRESMYAASSPQAVRDALLAARAERAERLERLERLERAADRPYLSRYEPLRDPLRRREAQGAVQGAAPGAAQAAQAALDPASLFTSEAGPSVAGSGPSSGSESGSSGLASSSSFEPNWDMTGMYTRRTPASAYASQMRLRERERIAAFERRIYGMNGPTYGQPGQGHPGQPGYSSGYAQVPGPLGTSPASAASASAASSSIVAGSSHAAAATTPFGSALERGHYAYARGDPYTLIAVPPEFARYAFGRRRLPASLEGMDEEQRRQAARDALDTVSRLGPEERRRLAEKVLQKVAYSALCSHASAASAQPSHSSGAASSSMETVAGGMMDNLELPAKPAKISWDAEVESACAICQDDYVPQDETVLTPCGHMYHSSCLGTWLARHNPAASTCPMCRRDLACLAVLRKMSDEGEAKRLWVSVGDEGERGGWI